VSLYVIYGHVNHYKVPFAEDLQTELLKKITYHTTRTRFLFKAKTKDTDFKAKAKAKNFGLRPRPNIPDYEADGVKPRSQTQIK